VTENKISTNAASPSPAPSGVKPANKRSLARLAAVQALYQMEIGGGGVMETVAEYEAFRLGKELEGAQYLAADNQWFRAILAGVVAEQSQIDPLIQHQLAEDWTLSRLDSILRAILRCGLWELKHRLDVPVAVIISEYVDIAKAFFVSNEVKTVNAVLDRLAKQLR